MNRTPREFLDSNILVYAFTSDPRAQKAQELLARGCNVGVQGLNEFANVARRKLGMSWVELRDALAAIRTLCHTILPIDINMHVAALPIAERYGLAVFDALMVAVDAFLNSRRPRLTALAATHAVPAIYYDRAFIAGARTNQRPLEGI